MSLDHYKVPLKGLRVKFDSQTFPFKTTADLPPTEEVIGQERAVRAMDFGLHIRGRGYNIYVSGVPGTGKNTIVKSMIRRVAEEQPTPNDWCYVNNFQDPDHPIAIEFPAGKARDFHRDMDRLIASVSQEFPKVFQSKEYEDERRSLEEEITKARDSLSRDLETLAKDLGFVINSSSLGVAVVPMHRGKPLEPDELEKLDPETRAEIRKKEKSMREHLHRFVQQIRLLREELDRKIENLNHRIAQFTSEHLFENLRKKYESFPQVIEYIHAVQQDMLENFKDFLPTPESAIQIMGRELEPPRKSMTRYAVNVIVDNSGVRGAPMVEEMNPTYNNLVGRIEKKGRFGTLYTDFTLIKAGSALQANGGYLLLNALDLLRSPFSWDALKRIIKNQQVKIEDLGETYGFISSAGIKPEPIPVTLRVILVGNPYLYYLLQTFDEDFGKIVKVKVDFDVQQKFTNDSPIQYSRFIARMCHEEGLLHFDPSGVARVLEQVFRWASHQKKLSLRFSDMANLIRESNYWAHQEGADRVSGQHVDRAVSEKIYRSNLLEEYIREMIAEGTLMVDVRGAVIGQINGLSIHELGDFSFGRPSRITARVFLGQSGIINIEREAKLSGKTHSKGVLILSGYLGGRYARNQLLSLSASIAFEQSYSEVHGDSASAAELLALLSSVAEIPINQGIAITGSVNQRGELQPIGGINEKIEGFFAVCKALGFTGNQGVIIPRQNTIHLMLKEEVVAAIASGKFHVYSAATVDEAIEILTGIPAGAMQPDGTYPSGTVNAAIDKRLCEMGDKMRALEGKTPQVIPTSGTNAPDSDPDL